MRKPLRTFVIAIEAAGLAVLVALVRTGGRLASPLWSG